LKAADAPLRIGILGAARVAVYAVIEAARDVEGVVIQAVAARDPGRAQAYAQTHGIPKVYADYDALINAPDVDAVYNALPPSLHAQWSIRAVAAGKPVLCEKPFALCVADVEAMLDAEARTRLIIMEAQHSHYHPLAARAREIVQGGTLGTLHSVSAVFDAEVGGYPTDIRFLPDVGGGALWDLGVYPAYWIRSVTGQEPNITSAVQHLADTGADVSTSAQFTLPCGAQGELSCNMAAPLQTWFRAEGSRGTLHIINPLAPQRGHKLTLTLDGETVEETFTMRSTFAFQLDAFRDAVLHGKPVATRGGDSLATLTMLARIDQLARHQNSAENPHVS
jgi:predicted dehydrogenase